MVFYETNNFSPPARPFLVVGLGNPGKNYRETRHNIGFMVVDQIAAELGLRWQEKSKRYEICSALVSDKQVFFVKPLKFMNTSGEIVRELLMADRIPLDHLIVICDDLNLPFGRIRIRGSGSNGGHNGMASIIQRLGSKEFARIRVGIGADFNKGEMSDFVLARFVKAEKKMLPEIISITSQATLTILTEDLDSAMNRFNQVIITPE